MLPTSSNIFRHLPTSSNIVKEPWSSFKLQALTKYRKQRFKDLSHVIFILPCECQTLSHFVANYDSFAERWQAQNTQNVSEKFGQNTSESLDMTFLMQFECMFERNESTKTKRSKTLPRCTLLEVWEKIPFSFTLCRLSLMDKLGKDVRFQNNLSRGNHFRHDARRLACCASAIHESLKDISDKIWT